MPELLLTILALAILANVLLLASIPLRSRSRRGAEEPEAVPENPSRREIALARARSGASASPVRRFDRGDVPDDGEVRHDGDARAVAAIEAFVAGVPVDASGVARPPSAAEVLERRRAVVAGTAPAVVHATRAPTGRPPSRGSSGSVASPAESTSTWAYPGVADRATWDLAVHEESARTARFRRPVTVVMAELPRLDDVVARLGREAAERAVAETARLLVEEGRASDQVAMLDHGLFGVLMPETEETRAREYVDRVRAAADDWLGQAGLAVRLSVGWASPTEDRDVVAAAALAQRRMREGGGAARDGGTDRVMGRDMDEGLSTTK